MGSDQRLLVTGHRGSGFCCASSLRASDRPTTDARGSWCGRQANCMRTVQVEVRVAVFRKLELDELVDELLHQGFVYCDKGRYRLLVSAAAPHGSLIRRGKRTCTVEGIPSVIAHRRGPGKSIVQGKSTSKVGDQQDLQKA
jgi:hypothetical protein